MGYVRVEEVSMRGQFSLRGDIFEIFPINEENLYRLEFFDTELEKISAISAGERKFKFEAENLDILGINQESGDGNILTFLSEFEKFLKNQNKNQDDLNFKENKNQSGLMVCFDEPVALQTLRDYFVKSNGESEFYVPSAKIFECGIKNQIAFASIQGKTFFVAEDIIPLRALACKKYVFDFPELAKDAKIHLDMGNDIFIFCGSAENKKHMQDFLTQNLIFPADIDDFYKIVSGEKQNKNKLKENKVYLLEDFLPYSFSIVKTGAIVIGTNDIFKKQTGMTPTQYRKAYIAEKKNINNT